MWQGDRQGTGGAGCAGAGQQGAGWARPCLGCDPGQGLLCPWVVRLRCVSRRSRSAGTGRLAGTQQHRVPEWHVQFCTLCASCRGVLGRLGAPRGEKRPAHGCPAVKARLGAEGAAGRCLWCWVLGLLPRGWVVAVGQATPSLGKPACKPAWARLALTAERPRGEAQAGRVCPPRCGAAGSFLVSPCPPRLIREGRERGSPDGAAVKISE